jgi:ribosomal protein S17E
MFYVVRKEKPITEYHARFHSETPARSYAENLKATFGHNYDVIKMSTTWTTQTLEEAIDGMTTVGDLRKQGVL